MELCAKWIWKQQQQYNYYNQTIIARKRFRLSQVSEATIRITADSYYRLYINDEWVNDGPCRSWPEHFQYDQIDVTSYLKAGNNEIKIIARYFGTGDFHHVPQQAGLLVQLDAKLRSGRTKTIISDQTWHIANAKAWITNTPKISAQMEPTEYYNACRENRFRFTNARILFDADKGPWKNLKRRDVALMTKKPFPFKAFVGTNIVRTEGINYCIPVVRLMHPGLIEANRNVHSPIGLATLLKVKNKCTITLKSEFRLPADLAEGVGDENLKITVDGKHNSNDRYNLSPGTHLILMFTRYVCSHDKELAIRFIKPAQVKLENPLNAQHENPWCFIPFKEFAFAKDDLQWQWFFEENPEAQEMVSNYNELTDEILKKVVNKKTFLAVLRNRAKCIPSEKMFVRDPYWQFRYRQVIADGIDQVDNPANLIHDNAESTVVKPRTKGDVELVYDLGEQNCGYYCFELIADEGVVVDIFSIEYINPDGKLQFPEDNRNGMRYITKQALNRFISLKRRSGRYIFITLRNQKLPVQIRNIQLIESTYPVNYIGSFSCSDTRLNRIWEISACTMKLCMEDTFTDCPLYEQTLWVGDARNESLFAYNLFGSTDIAKRCIQLAAQSLDKYPIVGSQVPSSWDCLLPAWSFLWGISVWDYYWFTDDTKFLKKIFPAVIKNLKGAETFVDKRGLFSGPFWNMFDWAGIDQDHKTVLHNSMFLVGCINAALKCAKVLGDQTHTIWLQRFRRQLRRSINNFWNEKKKAYPDSIHDNGLISDSISQHTSFLSILYGIIEKKNIKDALKNVINPPQAMVRVGSPFAILYLYETLEKMHLEEEIIKSIYNSYLPMLDADATTVWESFSTGTTGKNNFPTRSHCHAWSAAPVYFLDRIILGIRQTSPAGKSFEIRPQITKGITWAKGTAATANGPIKVSWSLSGKLLKVKITAPEKTKVKFTRNKTHKGKRISITRQSNK